jgi:hypothetical protein
MHSLSPNWSCDGCLFQEPPLSRGAVPVFGGGPDGPHDWIVQRQYGSRPEEIVESVVREWLANGAQDEDPGGLWFALPQYAWTPPS